jgi:nucleoside-diphosphate-sugar epimerase
MKVDNTVLITGAGGFIGRNLVEAQLATGRRVIALDINIAALERFESHGAFTGVRGDIRSNSVVSQVVQDVEVVFNLAAAHLEVGSDEDHFRSVNVTALENLLRASRSAGVRRFVHCSSVGVYGPLRTIPADEDTECHPEIAYEKTKFEGEHIVRSVADDLGLDAVILRPSWVYGPGCPRTLKIVRSVLKKRFFFAGNGGNLRHPIYVGDLLTAFELAAAASLPGGEVILVAGPCAVSTRELVDEITRQLGSQFKPPKLPLELVRLGCFGMEKIFSFAGREPPFSTRSLKFFEEDSSFTTDKARRLLGFEPTVELAEGLRQTIAHYRQHEIISS